MTVPEPVGERIRSGHPSRMTAIPKRSCRGGEERYQPMMQTIDTILTPLTWGVSGDPGRLALAVLPHLRRQFGNHLGSLHRRARGRHPDHVDSVVRQADPGVTQHGPDPAEDEGTAEEIRRRPGTIRPGNDEVVQGVRDEPVLLVPADPGAVADPVCVVPGAQRGFARPGPRPLDDPPAGELAEERAPSSVPRSQRPSCTAPRQREDPCRRPDRRDDRHDVLHPARS